MPASSEVWINLLMQVPLVGIFVWAMLMLIEKMNKFQAAMMEQWDKKQAERDQIWRRFLEEQREVNNAALARIADEVKAMRDVLAGHDGRMTGKMEQIAAMLVETTGSRRDG